MGILPNLENLGNNLVGGAGWHELNIPGSDTANQAAAAAKAEFPKGATPTNAAITPARVASTAIGLAGGSGADIFAAFTKWFGQPALWERVSEVAVGLIILYVGIKAIATPAGQNPAKKTFKDTAKHVAEAALIPK